MIIENTKNFNTIQEIKIEWRNFQNHIIKHKTNYD